MLRRPLAFLRRHRHAEEVAGEAIGLNLLWAFLRYAGVIGATVAVAAVVSSTSPAPRRVPVPQRLALETPVQKQLVRSAHRYGPGSGLVYVWGGSSPFGGFDCSGFVYYLYSRQGIRIPRDSRSQWTSTSGQDIRKGHERPGDVVYFDGSRSGVNAGPPPGHEGFYIGGGKFIEYYSTGHPARVALLRDEPGYMGAKRWWQPVTVQKRHAALVFWFARYFHVRIAAASKRSVTFEPWRGHGRIPAWRYRRILRWLQHHPHAHSGNPRHLHVRF
jgi:hypothetical protein